MTGNSMYNLISINTYKITLSQNYVFNKSEYLPSRNRAFFYDVKAVKMT